jgi:branched-chain amino acid transport system permease protein
MFNITFDNYQKMYYLYLIFVLILVFVSFRIVKSKWGRLFKAIRDNVEAVEASGINIASIKIKAFTLATTFGCFGGAMYVFLMGYINPVSFTPDLSANYLVMMMLGGIGSVGGNIVGAVIVTILPELLRFIDTYYWLVFSIIALIFAIFLPNGIISLFEKGKILNFFRFAKIQINKEDR